MRIFGYKKHYICSKRITVSGVGSAVQNLLGEKIDNALATTVVSAQQNQADLGETFKNFLSSGTGLRLRSAIDYAHQKGYTDTVGWKISKITGEVFSDTTAYKAYLAQYVYPSGASTSTTPETTVSETITNQTSYTIGDNTITEKTIHRICNKTVTTTTTSQSFTENLYYQGTHTEFLTINNFINSDIYKNLSEYSKDTAIAVSGTVEYYTRLYGTWKLTETSDKTYTGWSAGFRKYSNVTMLLISPETTGSIKEHNLKVETIPTTHDGFVIASIEELLTKTCLRSYTATSQGGGEWQEDESIPWEEVAATESYAIYRQNQDSFINDPNTTLNFASNNSINLVKVKFVLGMDPGKSQTGGGYYDGGYYEEPTYRYDPECIWWNGYALITTATPLSSKVLVANMDVHKTVTKHTSVISTEYVITEKYTNGKLTSSSTVTGAVTSQNSSETLEDKTITHLESYSYGSGNSRLDAIIDNTKSITEQFMPVMPVKTWGTLCSSSWGDLYNAERKLYRKITTRTLNKWDEFLDNFKDVGDDAKMIYYWLAIPINVDHEFANEYFFHFFKWLAINFNGMNFFGSTMTIAMKADNNIDFKLKYDFKVTYKVVSGTPPIPCKTHGYARYHVIANNESDDSTSESWKGGFDDEWSGSSNIFSSWVKKLNLDPLALSAKETYVGTRENYPELTDDEYKALVASSQYTVTDRKNLGTSSISFYYKINDKLYEKVYVTNFVFHHFVRSHSLEYYLKNSLSKNWEKAVDEDATNDEDAGFSPIIIPIARGALESMGWYRQSNILDICHNIIISGYDQKKIKVKWYQSTWFKIVLIIVIIVITIFTCGAGAAAAGAGASAGAGGASAGAAAGAGAGAAAGGATAMTMAAIADMAIQAIACTIICKVITWAANKYIGGVFGTIVGIVASVVACYFATGFYQQNLALSSQTTVTTSLWDRMLSWDGFMDMSSAVMKGANEYMQNKLQNQYNTVQNQYNQLVSDQTYKSGLMKSWELETNNAKNSKLLNILVTSSYTNPSTYTDDIQFTMPEDPDTYYDRITGAITVYDNTIAYVEHIVDLYDAISRPYPLNLYS